MLRPLLLAAALLAAGTAASAQNLEGRLTRDMSGAIVRTGGLTGEMTATMPGQTGDGEIREVLRFEPWQMLDDLFRDDIVLLMRHGQTDWSMRDISDVAPTDCENQRVMTEAGKEQMRQLGILLVANEMVPGKILVSEWCRNQQTVEALRTGMLEADAESLVDTPIETVPALNLLLSLQGAPTVTDLRRIVTDWDGGDGTGPLLVVSHYTNIEELTEFRIYEGEMLVVDPKRNNRVLGYLRLKSAGPDIGHFADDVVAD